MMSSNSPHASKRRQADDPSSAAKPADSSNPKRPKRFHDRLVVDTAAATAPPKRSPNSPMPSNDRRDAEQAVVDRERAERMERVAEAPPPMPIHVPRACAYETGRVLGSGSYAVVKEAIHTTTGKKYAVKIVSKKLIRTDRIRNELEILRKLSKGNPNIVKLHDTFETQNNVYFVMDLCEGGNLFEALLKRGKYDETDVARIIKVVVTAVGYLHENNIVHRDIKEGNLLFLTTDARFEDLLIADFGLSRVLDETSVDMLMTACGTPGYMAPEVVRSHPYGTPADMWSIGVLTFILLSGYMPFGFEHSGNSLTKILNGQYSFAPEEVWEDISLDAQDFISKLLLVDPSARMDARSALEHPWLLYAEQRAEEWAEGASRAEELARGVKVRLDEMKVVPPTPARSDPPVAVAAEVQGGEEVVKQGLPSVAYGTLNLTRNLKAFDGKRVFKRAVGLINAVRRLNSMGAPSRPASTPDLNAKGPESDQSDQNGPADAVRGWVTALPVTDEGEIDAKWAMAFLPVEEDVSKGKVMPVD